MTNGMPWPSSQDDLTVLWDVWPSAVHQLLFNNLLKVSASSVRNWQDGIRQCYQTDLRGETNRQGIDNKILAQCHLEHPDGDPHERPPDPRRLHKELPQKAPPDTAPANPPEFEIPLSPVCRKVRENSRHQHFLASGCSGSISGSARANKAPSYFQREVPQKFLAVPGIFLHAVKACCL